MEDKTNVHLTAPEMAGLWTQYINQPLAVCVMSYFLEKANIMIRHGWIEKPPQADDRDQLIQK
jgi:hypothetical protein